jgi:hypothetical protein
MEWNFEVFTAMNIQEAKLALDAGFTLPPLYTLDQVVKE